MFQWILETLFREFSICFVQAVQLHTKYLKGKITKNVTESHTKYHEDLKRSNYHKHVHLPYFSLLFLILFNTVYSLQYTLQRSMSREHVTKSFERYLNCKTKNSTPVKIFKKYFPLATFRHYRTWITRTAYVSPSSSNQIQLCKATKA